MSLGKYEISGTSAFLHAKSHLKGNTPFAYKTWILFILKVNLRNLFEINTNISCSFVKENSVICINIHISSNILIAMLINGKVNFFQWKQTLAVNLTSVVTNIK